MPKVNTADTNIVHSIQRSQSKLLELAVVKSVHTCRRIFLSFSFCSTCKRFICFYSTTPTPSSPGFKRMNWAQLLSSSFFLFLLSIDFHCKEKKDRAIISLMMFVFGCVQKLASKIASFFAPKFLSLAHDCDQVERKCDQKNSARARPEKFCDWHRKDFSSPATPIPALGIVFDKKSNFKNRFINSRPTFDSL